MAGRKEAQDMETGRLQQQEARLKLDDFQRKQAGLDQFLSEAEKRGQTGDPVDVASSYYKYAMTQRSPELITQATTLLQTAQQRKKFNELQNSNQLAGAARPIAPAGTLGSGTFDPNAPAPTNALAPTVVPSATTPTNALAPRAAAPDRIAEIKNRLFQLNQFRELPEAKAEAEMLVKEYDRLTTPHVVGGSLMSGSGSVIGTAPKEATPPASVAEFERAQKDPAFMRFLQQRAAAGRAPATPSAPVAVVGPDGTPILVTREQSFGMKPASAQESLPPKEIQKREAALPAATSAMKGFESKSDSFIADLKALRDHPGLSSITGLVYGRTPSATREGRAAQALYDKVVAKGGFQALQDLRDASKTGGALGNVSNTEGAQLKSSFAAIDRTQDAPDVQAAIDQAISSIEGSKTRMREAYDSTYSYKAGGSPAAALAGGPKVVDFGSLK
jgi:hypothetical protein